MKLRSIIKQNKSLNQIDTNQVLYLFWEQSKHYDNIIDIYPDFENQYFKKRAYYMDWDDCYEQDFKFLSQEQAKQYADNLLRFYREQLPNPIQIYRVLYVDDIHNVDRSYLGKHWSHDRQSALKFGQTQLYPRGNVIITAMVNKKDVNWQQTIRHHYHFTLNYGIYPQNQIFVSYPEKVFSAKVKYIK